MLDRELYERELKRVQGEHLRRVRENWGGPWQPCAHDACPECHGKGVKLSGAPCIHMLYCSCPKCSVYSGLTPSSQTWTISSSESSDVWVWVNGQRLNGIDASDTGRIEFR